MLQDEAARASNHVQANQFAPIIKLITFFYGHNGIGFALPSAFKLGFAEPRLAHVVLRAYANVGFFVNKQAQLAGKVGLGFVVRCRGQ